MAGAPKAPVRLTAVWLPVPGSTTNGSAQPLLGVPNYWDWQHVTVLTVKVGTVDTPVSPDVRKF